MDEKKFIIEFLDEYRQLTALWDTRSKAYNDKKLKNEQYEQLLKKYRERYPNATRDDLSKKINILRTNYRKEVKRLEEEADDDCDTSLYYYDAISFLKVIDKPRRHTMHMYKSDELSDSKTNIQILPRITSSLKKRKKSCPEDPLIELAGHKLSEPRSDPQVLSEGWHMVYKKLSADQKMYAQKFISDILFEGQMGTLHRNSIQLNVDMSPTYTHEEII